MYSEKGSYKFGDVTNKIDRNKLVLKDQQILETGDKYYGF